MNRSYFKLNIEDVMEIVTEKVADLEGYGTFSTRAQIIYENGIWYMLIVVGELDDEEIDALDMEELSKTVEYNGTHGKEGYWQDWKRPKNK